MSHVVASIRPDDWNFALFLHVLGAMLLVGSVLAAVGALLTPTVAGDPVTLRRFAFRTLLFAGLPSYILMRIGAEWIYSKEFGDLPDDVDEPAWVGIGYITADIGALLFLIALICARDRLRQVEELPREGRRGHRRDRADRLARHRLGDGREARLT